MFNKILVATEGTPIMGHLTEYIATLFPQAQYHVISVVDTSVGSIDISHHLTKLLKERTEEALAMAREIFEKHNITNVVTRALRGKPASQIASYAHQENVDLVVLGTSTKSGVVKFTFGHVGENLIRILRPPILIINQEVEIRKPARILSPTDGGIHSKEAGKVALFMANYFNASLHKFFVGSDRELGKRVLDAAEEWAHEVGVEEVTKMAISEHDPAEDILRLADDFDMIVMGKGKKTFLRRDILGATSREVAALSPIAVLLIGTNR